MPSREDLIRPLVKVGTSVELQTRLQDDSPVLHTGTVTKLRREAFVVKVNGLPFPISFNLSGLCVPDLHQLQVKVPK